MAEVLRPLFDYVLVQELKHEEEVRQSGVVVPATQERAKLPPQAGVVVAAGPGLDWWEGAGVAMPVKPGDKVMFPYTAGTYVDVGEQQLLAMRVGMILGVVEDVDGRVAREWGRTHETYGD